MTDLPFEALKVALKEANRYISKAKAVREANVAACVEYLRAAKSALVGLEEEADEILIEAKQVSEFYWDYKDKRAGLSKRIDEYLNRDRLRPVLDQAIHGVTECYQFIDRNEIGFFQGKRQEKEKAKAEVRRLLADLSNYLASLGQMMKYSRENYAGPSGRNMEELEDIQRLLGDQGQASDQEARRARIGALVEKVQADRERRGFAVAADVTRTIQQLIVTFALIGTRPIKNPNEAG